MTFIYPNDGMYWNDMYMFLIPFLLLSMLGMLNLARKSNRIQSSRHPFFFEVVLSFTPFVILLLFLHSIESAYDHRDKELATVVAQTYNIDTPYFETLDGSTDSTSFIIRKDGKSLNKKCVIHHVNGDRLVGQLLCRDLSEAEKAVVDPKPMTPLDPQK